ncbi:MAG TPA: choice-of-anchor D domain-containing protein, partial [Gammaproteobacteria bacterium]|nr:choice-of-anchor D domain-containing protein [Gammaproteobacteria bacterium]
GGGGDGNGGALFNHNGVVTVRYTTFAGNAASAGGAVYNAGAMTVNSSILAGSTDGNGAAADDCGSSGAFVSGFDVVQQPGDCSFNNNDQTADPQLATGAPTNNGGPTPTIALQSGSPAIDHGDTGGAPATDQRGYQRDSEPDAGSYEFIAAPTISGLDDVTVTEGESVPPVSFTLSGSAPLTVTATSSNTDLLPASGLTISSGCGSDTSHYNCTLTLAPTANKTGTSTVTVKVADDHGGHDQQSMSFTVNGPTAPAIAFSPASLDFGSVAVGSTATGTETLKNTGTAPLTFQNIRIAGDTSSVFQITANNCDVGSDVGLSPGASCTVVVRFAPAAARSYAAGLRVNSNAPTSPVQAALSGTGTAIAGGGTPAVSLSPASIDYGTVTIGQTLTRTETLTNSGEGALSISGVELTGAGAGAFHITAKTCGDSLAAGASCAITLEFAPTAADSYSATLQISSDASSSPDNVPLSGTGSSATTPAPVVSLSAGSLNFGSVAVGASATRAETLTNTGNASLSIESIAIGGDAGDNFQVAANGCGSSLAAGKSCTIEVVFAPAATTTYTGTLTIRSNASSSPDDVGLSGTGSSSGGGGGEGGPPTAISASYTLSANHTFSGQLQGSAANGATLSYAVVTQPAHGQLKVDTATGAFAYTPSRNFVGSDEFTFNVSDGTQQSASATVSLTIVRGDLTVKNGGGGAMSLWVLAMLCLISAPAIRRRSITPALILAATVWGACLVPAPARAADASGWYAGLQLNLIKPDNARTASTSGFSGRTLTGGRYFGNHFALEVQRAYHSDHPRSLYGIANWVTWGVNALWYPRLSSDTISLFVFVGAGHEFEYRGDGSEPSTNYANAGFGVTRRIGTSPFRIRVDVQTQHAFSGGFNDFVGSLGVTYSF